MGTIECKRCKNDKNEIEFFSVRNGLRTLCNTCVEKKKCVHNKEKTRCFECGGGNFCKHKKRNSRCLECGGSEFCIHKKMRYICTLCKGTGTCEHGKQKSNCKICDFRQYSINLQRSNIRRMLKLSVLGKTLPTIEYLGCNGDNFIKYLQKKMTPEMTLENIHIDHIKPVSKFNLDDYDEFLKCCHYTNLQPLLAEINMSKSNKWCDEWNDEWETDVIYKETTKLYFLT